MPNLFQSPQVQYQTLPSAPIEKVPGISNLGTQLMQMLLMRLGSAPAPYRGAASPGVGPGATSGFSAYTPAATGTTGQGANLTAQQIVDQVMKQLGTAGIGSGMGAGLPTAVNER